MKKLRPDLLPVALLALMLVLAGFLREWVFEQINLRAALLYYGLPHQGFAGILSPFNGLDYQGLHYIKFPLTLTFILLFLILTLSLVHTLFHRKILNITCLLLYGGVMILSAGIYLAGVLTGKSEITYTISRMMAGWLQSPVMAMLLVPAGILLRKAGQQEASSQDN